MPGGRKRRLGVNFKAIRKVYIRILGTLFTVLGALAVFFDLQAFMPGIVWRFGAIAGLMLLAGIPAVIFVMVQRRTRIDSFDGPKTLVVKFGDLFCAKSKIRVIAVNRCFDTIVNTELISPNSLHGAWLRRYLISHSREELDRELDRQLKDKEFEEIPEKRLGKKRRYPAGTVVEIRDGDICYYLTAMTVLDEEKLTAGCTVEAYCMSILRLMQYYNEHGQQEDIALPLLGSGAARIPKKENELLQCMLALIKMGRNHGQGNIEIILREELREKISLGELH